MLRLPSLFFLLIGFVLIGVLTAQFVAPGDIDGITLQEKTCAKELVSQQYDHSGGYIFKKSVEGREGKILSVGIYTWFGRKLSLMKIRCDGDNEQILSIH